MNISPIRVRKRKRRRHVFEAPTYIPFGRKHEHRHATLYHTPKEETDPDWDLETFFAEPEHVATERRTEPPVDPHDTRSKGPVREVFDKYASRGGKISPFHSEHYYLANAAYLTPKDVQYVERYGYRRLVDYSGSTMSTFANPHTMEIVFAHKGTQITSFKDLKSDSKIAFGFAGNFADEPRIKVDQLNATRAIEDWASYGYSFSATGHSLGGTAAAFMGAAFDIPYTAFNAGSANNQRLFDEFNDLTDSTAVEKGKSREQVQSNGTFYRYGKDEVSAHADKMVPGATHVDLQPAVRWLDKIKERVVLGQHNMDKFEPFLDAEVAAKYNE